MAALTPEQLQALRPEYLMEVNPTAQALFRTSIAFIVLDTAIYGLYMSSVLYKGLNEWQKELDVLFLMPIGYLATVGNAVFGVLFVEIGGVGRRFAYHLIHNPGTITTYLQMQTGIEINYMASITVPKIVILVLYLKIFTDRLSRSLAYIIIVILVLFFFSGLGLALALCQPYAFKWDKTINGHCGDIMAGYRWISIPSIITDFVILVIPIPTIWKLQMSRYRKVGLFLTFLTGSLGFITAIVRCLTFYQANLFEDPTYKAGYTMVWTVIESSAYFICACLPRLRPLLKLMFTKLGVTKILKGSFRSGKTTPLKVLVNGKNSGESSQRLSRKVSDDTSGFIQLDNLNTSTENHLR